MVFSMKNMSTQLAAHAPNVVLVISDGYAYLDATGYDDGATVYVDGDRFLKI